MTHRSFLNTLVVIGLLAFPLALGGEPAAQAAPDIPSHFVKPVPTGSGDCSSWEDACELQTALGLANSGDEIWVAQGVYTPTLRTVPEDARTATFQLESGVVLYGGFTGTEAALEQRDWMNHATVLSGDIDNNDVTDPNGVITDTLNIQGANAYHVVTGSGVVATATLDGFTITAGNATTEGGGMYNLGGSPTLTNVTFSGNLAGGTGGGMFNWSSNPTLTHVTFFTNSAADRGGGMFNYLSNPTLTGVDFFGNSATSGGGGMFSNYSNPTLANVTFYGNSTNFWGGGLFSNQSTIMLINVNFFSNSATSRGGGMYNDGSIATLTNTLFTNNEADEGGGMYNNSSNPALTNAILWGNTAPAGAQIFNNSSTPLVTNSDIQGSGGSGASWDISLGTDGGSNIDADPLFVDAPGGNLRLLPGSPAIDAGDNTAEGLSGVTTDLDGSPRIVDIPGVRDPGAIVDMGVYEAQIGSDIIYVDRTAPGPIHDGTSWTQAFTGLQAALAAAQAGDEIWVAAGVYNPGITGNRLANFHLKDGVALYGGFDPDSGADTFEERDWQTHPTVLSGDIGTPGVMIDNVYNVLFGREMTEAAVLDGFTITGGYAMNAPSYDQNFGGGLFAFDGILRLENLAFEDNSAETWGGGLYVNASDITLVNVTFSGNSASHGGGMYNNHSSATLTDVTFSGNIAGGWGGGINNWASSPTLTNVAFSGNTAESGGGMFSEGGVPELVNVEFLQNEASINGGGLHTHNGSSTTLTNVTFYGNHAGSYGGGAYNGVSSNLALTNAILWGNTAATGGVQIYQKVDAVALTVSYSIVEGGCPAGVTCDHLLSDDPLFLYAAGGNLRLLPGSPAIDAGNNAAEGLTGITTDLDGNPRFVDIPGVRDPGAIVDMGAYEASFDIIYVDETAPGPIHDGTSWTQAFSGLQDGLAAAQAGDEIWVAQGVYKPTVPAGRSATFQLESGVALYGGFDPGSEVDTFEERDWQAYPTVLSGDIGTVGVPGDNVYHVVTGSGTNTTAILDGFTITAGNANSGEPIHQHGGGIYNILGSPTLSHINFSGNHAVFSGGGLYDENSSPRLTDITFSGNSVGMWGGGMLNSGGIPILINVVFSGNSANNGGGMYNQGSNPALTNVTFSGNSAVANGGGMYNGSSNPTLTNAILWGNTAPAGAQIYNVSSTPVITYSDIQGGYAGLGNIDTNPLFVDAPGGDLRLLPGSPAVDAGNNAAVPLDVTTDLDGRPRFEDIPSAPNTGNGTPPIVDMGAYEATVITLYLPVMKR